MNQGISKKIKFLNILLILAVILIKPAPAAFASPVFSYVSPLDSYTPPTLLSSYDLQYLQVYRDSSDLNNLTFVVYFAQPIGNSLVKYVNGKEPFGLLSIWRTNPLNSIGGNSGDIEIFSGDKYITGNTPNATTVYGNSSSGGSKTTKTNCNAKYWSDLNSSARWLAFSVDKNCATIPDKFWVDFYIDQDGAAGSTRTNFDWVASSALQIDLNVQSLQNPPITSPFTINGNVLATPTPTPVATITKLKQTLSGFSSRVFEIKSSPIDLPAYSDQNMPITWVSKSPGVCRVSPFADELFFDDSGSCQLVGTANGNYYYNDENFYIFLSIWNDYSSPTPKVTVKATPKATKKPIPTPKKTISGSATASKKPTASPKATVGSKIGGTASGK